MVNKILIASDHAGYDLKEKIKSNKDFDLFEFVDIGPSSSDRVDYPDYAHKLCREYLRLKDSKVLGILICGSGQGMAITANKHEGVRAALCWSEDIAKLAREHNDANVLCLSAREISEEENYKIIKSFISAKFEGGRHQDRVNKI